MARITQHAESPLLTLDVNCFAGAGTVSLSFYLLYYKPALTDTQRGRGTFINQVTHLLK